MGTVLRNLVLLAILACVGWPAVVALNVALLAANYMSVKAALELSNFEMRPIWTDELVGGVFSAFVPEATLAHYYAAVMSLTVAVGVFVLCNRGFHVFYLLRDRALYVEENDQRSVKAVKWHLIEAVAVFVLFAVPLIAAACWDMELFRFRTIAWSMGFSDDPLSAVQLADWKTQMAQNSDMWVWCLARMGAWGYIAITVLAAVCLDYTTRSVGNVWARFCASLAQAWGDWLRTEEPKESLASSPNRPAPPAPRVDSRGAAVEESTSPAAATRRAPPGPERTTAATPPQAQPPASTPDAHATLGGHLRPVIGSPHEVTLEEALADRARYWVDPDTHDVWDVRLRNGLLAEEDRRAA